MVYLFIHVCAIADITLHYYTGEYTNLDPDARYNTHRRRCRHPNNRSSHSTQTTPSRSEPSIPNWSVTPGRSSQDHHVNFGVCHQLPANNVLVPMRQSHQSSYRPLWRSTVWGGRIVREENEMERNGDLGERDLGELCMFRGLLGSSSCRNDMRTDVRTTACLSSDGRAS